MNQTTGSQVEEIVARIAAAGGGRRSSRQITAATALDVLPDGLMLRGDHDLNPGVDVAAQSLKQAAVLVPLMLRDSGIQVLLTQRSAHLHDHAGQVAFPGGRVDPGDQSLVDTALREAEEEVGLKRGSVRVIGELDLYVTRTGFEVTPVVGLVSPPFELMADHCEVAEIFEVPLNYFLDPDARRIESRVWQEHERFFYVYPWRQRHIWGATAGMLNNLAEVLIPR